MRAPLSQFHLESPSSLEDALARMEASGGRLTPMAGGTDLYVYLNAGTIQPGHWIDLWGLDELRGIREDDTHFLFGALTTYSQLRQSDLIRGRLPLLLEAAATVGASAAILRAGSSTATVGAGLSLAALDAVADTSATSQEKSASWSSIASTKMGSLERPIDIPEISGSA